MAQRLQLAKDKPAGARAEAEWLLRMFAVCRGASIRFESRSLVAFVDLTAMPPVADLRPSLVLLPRSEAASPHRGEQRRRYDG